MLILLIGVFAFVVGCVIAEVLTCFCCKQIAVLLLFALQDKYYKAAVVEYSPYEGKGSPSEILKQNVIKYIEFIQQAAEQVMCKWNLI